MKRTLVKLLNAALQPFGLRTAPRRNLLDEIEVDRCSSLIERWKSIADEEAMRNARLRATNDQLSDLLAKPVSEATLPPSRRRRGPVPMVERLTMAQVKMVRNKRLSTNRLAKKLGVTWPTANKLRDELA